MIVVLLSLTACLAGQVPTTPAPNLAPWPASEPEDEDEDEPEFQLPPPSTKPFVFGVSLGVTFGVSPIPSGDLFSLFFGRRLKRGPWALGYQLTFSTGLADRYAWGLAAHRHLVMAVRHFGARRYGFAGVGGGLAFLGALPLAEVEGRIAVRFGDRGRALFGGLARLGWNFSYGELAPMPQLGLFLGFSTL